MDLAGAGIYSHIYTGIYMTYIFSWENVNILKFLKTSIFFKSWKKNTKRWISCHKDIQQITRVQKIMLFYKFLLKSLYVRGEVMDMTGSVVAEHFTMYTDTGVIRLYTLKIHKI